MIQNNPISQPCVRIFMSPYYITSVINIHFKNGDCTQVFIINGILPQTKEAVVSTCSLQEQWSHVITAEMIFFSHLANTCFPTPQIESWRVKNIKWMSCSYDGTCSIVATGPVPVCREVRVCQPLVTRSTHGWKTQLPTADWCRKQTILDREDNRKRGCGWFQTLSNSRGFESVRRKVFGCFIFIREGCPPSAVASEQSPALKMLCWTNSRHMLFLAKSLNGCCIFVHGSVLCQFKDGRLCFLHQQRDGGLTCTLLR